MTERSNSVALRMLHRSVTRVQEWDVSDASDGELLADLDGIEREQRRLAVASSRIVAELEERRVARRWGFRSTSALLRRQLRLSPAVARARVEGCRTDLPDVRPGEAAGDLSPEHARVIGWAIDQLPVRLRDEHAHALQVELAAAARQADPRELRALASRRLEVLDPDRLRRREIEHRRHRSASLVVHPDGSGDLRAHLAPAGVAVVQAALMPLAAPRPADDGQPDPRTAPQRLADPVVEAGRRLLAMGAVPAEGGAPAVVIVTFRADQLRADQLHTDEGDTGQAHGVTRHGVTRHGVTRHGVTGPGAAGHGVTAYGQRVSVTDLEVIADEAEVLSLFTDARGAPLALGRSRRFASKAQTMALIARDKGCSFPGCDAPPPWTQRHHVVPWSRGGPTDLGNLTLLCSFHHANFGSLGWDCVMNEGIPRWVPPASTDPRRTPISNTAHDDARGLDRCAAA